MDIPRLTPSSFVYRPFDYLVIGGGTAGLVVANRLSANPKVRVGVIEAGPASFDADIINNPGRYGESLGTNIDWQLETTPQEGLLGRQVPCGRGKVLGGTSALNFMTWNRPSRKDIDAWRDLGNQGWGWDDLLPYYKKSEDFAEPESSMRDENKLHYDTSSLGVGGPIPICYMKSFSPSHKHWHTTLNALGIETNRSHMSGSNLGVWSSLASVDSKISTRAYAANAYYLPVADRPNLLVLSNAIVKEVLLEHGVDSYTAKGASFDVDGNNFKAIATQEVIISAGSFASPQLLELSGIGDPQILEAAGVTVKVANSNVGENLQDHLMTSSIYEIDSSIPTRDDLKADPVLAAAANDTWMRTQDGPHTILPISLSYVSISELVPAETLQSMASQWDVISDPDRIRARCYLEPENHGHIEYIFDVGNWSNFMPTVEGKKYATMLQILQYPFSRGSVHIPPRPNDESSTDVIQKPILDPRLYNQGTGQLDLSVQELGLKFQQKIFQQKPLADFVQKRVWPPREHEDDHLIDWVKENTETDWHPVGTCAMGGSAGSKAGVVDERLRVYGVKGLRVVDASVMPLQISAHLQATVYAVAEKASVMILEDAD